MKSIEFEDFPTKREARDDFFYDEEEEEEDTESVEFEDDFYNEEAIEEELHDDLLSTEEAAFMHGYLNALD